MADQEQPKTNAVATTRKAPTLADLAPKGIDGRLWVKTIKDNLMGSKNGEPTDEELFYFARVSQASSLDPAKREIYAIFRNVKQKDGTYKPRMSIQTGIDGLRVVAERSGKYAGSNEPEFDYDPDYKIQINVGGTNRIMPNKARVTVIKVVGNKLVETTRSARWEEYYPGDSQGAMWKKMPEVMLGKVAEAQALRAAFPNVTEGLYIEEEMQQADVDIDTGTDLEAIKKRVDAAKSDDDLMDILGDYTPDIQKKITPGLMLKRRNYAMIVQRTDEWYKARLGKATASNFDKIMAGERYAGWKNYRAELVAERLTGIRYAELTGRDFTTFEMQWGTDNEPLARLHYSLRSHNEVEECGFFEHDNLAAGASPDGLIGADGMVEIKCPNTATHIETLRKGTVPRQYVAQVQGQMWITGRKWSDFISFDPRLPDNAKVIIIHVPRDEEYIAKMEAEITRFLQQVEEECGFVTNFNKEPENVISNIAN